MIKTILIDDEPLSREIIKAYLLAYTDFEVIEECNDGFEGVKSIQKHEPDLVFLDIQMPKISGFEMLELIENPPHVIFSTAFEEYAIKAFEANAIDYLLKPYSEERFRQAIEKLKERIMNGTKSNTGKILESIPSQQGSERIVVKTGAKVKIIPVREIHYLQADDDYVKIVTSEGSYLKNKTMSFYDKTLDPKNFVRVHRSYILHINQITKIDPYQKESHLATLRDGTQIPVSKTGYAKLKVILGL